MIGSRATQIRGIVVESTAKQRDDAGRLADTMFEQLPPLAFIAFTACCCGLAVFGPVMLPVAGGVVLLGLLGACVLSRLTQPGAIRNPGKEHLELTHPDDRKVFTEAVTLADRIAGTWKKLPGLIDAVEFEEVLVASLWDLAAALHRRHALRNVRIDLDRHAVRDLPDDNPAMQNLRAQRDEVDRLTVAADTEVAGYLKNLTTTATAAERLVKEQAVESAVRDANASLAALDRPNLPLTTQVASDYLAEHTEAVITAYRELADRTTLTAPA